MKTMRVWLKLITVALLAALFALPCAMAEETCPHTYTQERIITAHQYEPLSDGLHSDCVTVLITSCCTECGFIVSLKESNDYILTDRHTFGSDGVCTACGAQNTCAHERLEKADMDAAITESEDLGDGTHRVVWERTGYMRCAVCKTETADSTWTETEEIICEHDFPNRCTSCGFNVECAHENTTTFFKGVKDRRYEAVDSVYHAQYGKKVEREYCYDCGEEIRITTAENETLQYMSPHSWKNGICGTCGYENACAHENTAYALNYVDRSEWIYVDAARHSRTRIYAQQEICTDCGAHTGVIGGIVESTQIQCHNFDEGICSCGYVNVCSHSKTMQKTEPREEWGIESVDETTHLLDCTEVTYTLCALCGETLSEELSERAWREYPHSMYGDACYCGYTITCAHENRSYTDVAEIADAYDCVSISDTEHAHTYSLYRYQTCLDCGTVFDDRNGIQVGMTTVNEPHSFIGGVCSLCGADEKKPTREEILAEMGTTGNDSYRFGDTGAAVLKLQEMLADLDYYEGKVSGNFGNLTEEAVKLFQKDHGIAADGICGPKTLRRIIDAYLGVEYTPTCEDYLAEMGADETTVYQLGDSGEGVLKLQEMLKTLGYYYGETTGNFGELTRNAVQNFQANYGFAYTGICDYNTLVHIICVRYGVETPACKHTTTREVIERRDARYEPVDEEIHHHIYEAVVVTRCSLCNKILDELDAGTFALPYNHNFSEGVCLSCGMEDPSPEEEEPENPCPHESVTPHLYKGADESIYEDLGDGLHHKVTRTGRMYNYCDDCSACVGDMFIGTVESVDEHTRKNACSLCTYRADCAHEAPRTELTYTEPELRPVDNAHHASCAHQITTVFCADCGDILSEETADEEQILYIGAHSGDSCYCGWENACDHPSTSVKLVNTYLSDITPRCRDEYTHVRNMIYEEINACTVCGMQVGGVISLKQKELIEPHYTYLDHCECGWKNPCAHTGATHEQEARQDCFGSYYVDENTHMEDAYYSVETICDDCGLTIAITEDVRKQKLLPHTFEEGECTGCHYITCSHEHVQIRTAADKTRVLYAEPVSANAHRLYCEKVKFAECMDCGTSFSGAAVGTAAVLQSHEVVGGSCIVCGQCAHLSEMRQQKVTGWDHSTLYYNAYMHESTSTKHMVETCGACGEVMREWNEQDNTHYSSHYYDKAGVCSGCDYQNPCTHDHAYRAVTNGYSSSYEDLDDTHHTAYRSRSTHMHCPDCLYTWDYQNEEAVAVTEKHSFGSEITECMNCGHINTCPHVNIEERYRTESNDVNQYLDENRHSELGTLYAYDKCLDCGAYGMNKRAVEENVIVYTRRHSDSGNGVCVCGHAYTCAHTNTLEIDQHSGSYTMPLDEQTHTHTECYTLWSICADCGEQLANLGKTLVSTTYGQHYFNDRGFCQSCYAQSGCTHRNVRSETLMMWLGSEIIDETQHKTTLKNVKHTTCLDCGRIVEDEVMSTKTIIQPHNLGGCGCEECGYASGVFHANTEMREAWSDTVSAEPLDETSHTALVDVWLSEFCTDCGAFIGYEVRGGLQTRTLPHNFGETDRCRDCGYVNTCEHDQKERFRAEGYAFSYTALDAQLHALNQDFQTELRCTDCGKVFSHGMERNVGSTAPHTLNANGRCIYCGYTDDLFGEVRTLTLPAMLREVHAEAFAGGAYTEVICPAGLEEIGARAFADCSALRRVVIPGDAIYIESDAFEGTSPVIYGMPESDAQAFAYEQDFIFLPLE